MIYASNDGFHYILLMFRLGSNTHIVNLGGESRWFNTDT